MQWLASLSVRRGVFATVAILIIVVFGVVGYSSLGVDKFPRVDFPVVTITTTYDGASPSAVETDVTDPIESVINTIAGIDTLSSISSEGISTVVAQFKLEKDGDEAAQEARDRVAAVLGELPAGVDSPVVQKMDPDSVPILMLSVKGDLPDDELTRIAEDVVQRRLETIEGVGQVQIVGGRKRRINIELDPVRLHAAGVTALEVQRAIGVSNADVPAGRLERGPTETTIRIMGRVGSPAHLADIVVQQRGEHAVRVRDVAEVVDGVEDAESAGFRDGVSSVVLAVRKQSGGNTVATVDAARAAVDELAPRLPRGVSLEVVRDNSDTIRTSIASVLEHLVLGGLLAALVVLVFLGDVRSTLISAISIPVSLVGTFALMSWAGFTLNMMTLLALALSVGIVIDDSIVVLENIHRYIHEKGMKPFPAAIAATKEIGLAVLATSLSLMAVFVPVAFMEGIVGRFLASFGLTMAFAVAISTIVSFTIVPMLSARFLPPATGHQQRPSVLTRAVDAFYLPVERAYMAMLRFSLRRRWVIVALSVASLAAIPTLAARAGGGFLPANDEAQFEIYVEAPAGTSLDATGVTAERIARRTRTLPGVAYTLTTIGDGGQKQRNVARIYVRLADPADRAQSQDAVMASARDAIGALPAGTSATVQAVDDFGSGSKNAKIQYVLTGPDLAQLEAYASRAVAELAKVPGVVDAETSAADPVDETMLKPDLDRASALGVDPGDVSATLAVVIGGMETSKYLEDGQQYDVFVRASETFRGDAADLGAITVPSRTLGQVPLSDVVTIEDGRGASTIHRLSREREVTVSANLTPDGDQGAAVAALETILRDLDMAPGYQAQITGESKEMQKMGVAFAVAFLLAFVFMYLILAAQFESWLHPLTILSALPLTVPFALLSLVLFGQQINLFSMLGLLVLFGVVKKNSILQIDQTNQLRLQGLPRHEAILEANRHRLRPILMTTVAFVAGMLPLVFSHGIGSGYSTAMATIVVGGQSLSLLLTLLAVPVIYTLFDDIGLRTRALAARFRRRAAIDRGAADVGAYGAAEQPS